MILHEGTAEEQRETHKIDLAKPEPDRRQADRGRRKDVLPYIAPPEAPTAVAGPKPKDATKDAQKDTKAPADPKGAPFQ